MSGRTGSGRAGDPKDRRRAVHTTGRALRFVAATAGDAGILDEESNHAQLPGRFARTYLTSVGSTIAAGPQPGF